MIIGKLSEMVYKLAEGSSQFLGYTPPPKKRNVAMCQGQRPGAFAWPLLMVGTFIVLGKEFKS